MNTFQINEQATLEDQCREFGMLLGLDQPVPADVLSTALHNETYAHNLLMSRRNPDFLNHLIANPPRRRQYGAPQEVVTEEKNFSNMQLVGKAGNALLKWGKTGFATVEKEVLERRENACLACSNLSTPTSTLQKLVSQKKPGKEIGRRTGNSVCKACGCTVSRKMRLVSEACPEQHPDKPGFTRWDEAINLYRT